MLVQIDSKKIYNPMEGFKRNYQAEFNDWKAVSKDNFNVKQDSEI